MIQDPIYMRPADVELLVGNPKKAKQKLGWETQTSFEELVRHHGGCRDQEFGRDKAMTQ